MVSLLTRSVRDMGGINDKLGAEVVKTHGLKKELSEVKDTHWKERDEHDNLCIAV